jgi:hypothetical protein
VTTDRDFRRCEFCGCNTNAAMRACCAQGRVADLDARMAASTARFMDQDQSDLDPELVRAAAAMASSASSSDAPPQDA